MRSWYPRVCSRLVMLIGLTLIGCGTGMQGSNIPVISEHLWRPAAAAHRQRVLGLLHEGFASENNEPKGRVQPGLLSPSSSKRAAKMMALKQRRDEQSASRREKDDGFRRLNPDHAVFNFLLEYYNVRGAKGSRRLGRWSPGLGLVTLEKASAAGVLCTSRALFHRVQLAGSVSVYIAEYFAAPLLSPDLQLFRLGRRHPLPGRLPGDAHGCDIRHEAAL
jgi:hypothetical protein